MKEPNCVRWYMEEQYLDIEFDDLCLSIEGVNSFLAEELTEHLGLNSIQSSHRFGDPPQVLLQKENVVFVVWKYPMHPQNRRPDPSTLTTLSEVVEDIIATMSADNKDNVRSKTKDELIEFHFGWGQGIRNYYNLWHNKALVKAIGVEHPDDASGVIIEEVWKLLRVTDNDSSQADDYKVSLSWHLNKQLLEISWGKGKSIVIGGIDLGFAETFAKELDITLIQMRSLYQHPDVKPQVMQMEGGITIKLAKE